MVTTFVTDNLYLAVGALGAVGAGCAVLFPLAMSEASRLPGVAPTAAVAALSSTAYAALLVGPPLVGVIADQTTLRTALSLAPVCLVLVALLPAATGESSTSRCACPVLAGPGR